MIPSAWETPTIALTMCSSTSLRGQVLDELAVELDVAHRQVLEVVERPEPGAEVVEREAAAEVGQAAGELGGLGHVRDRGRLGDLEDQLGRVDRGALELALDHPQQLRVADHGLAAEVDSDLRDRRPSTRPISWIARATTQRSIAWISPKRSAAGRNAPGRDQLPALALHAQQQLAVLDLAGGELEDRLQVQDEAIAVERVLDPLGPGQLRHRARLARLGRGVDHDPVAAGGLGRVHREVGVDQHLAGGGVV